MVVICKEEFQLSSSLQKRVDLLEGSLSFAGQTDDQLKNLEAVFVKNLEEVRRERWVRQLKKESGNMKVFCQDLDEYSRALSTIEDKEESVDE